MDMPLGKYINTYVNILLRTFSESHFHNIDMKYYLRLARRINDILHRIFSRLWVRCISSYYTYCMFENTL